MSHNTRSQYKKKKRRKKLRLKRVLFVLLILLLIPIGYGVYLATTALNAANESYQELDRGSKSKLREKEVEIAKDPVSILLMGVEDYSSGGNGGRTDTLLVATLNPKNHSMKLLSIPRDTLVYIPNKGYKDKINHAYGSGEEESTIETVEEFLDIPIDYYATINFNGFKTIIDEIGGVTVDVPFDFWEKSDEPGQRRLYFEEGKMKLNGEEALAYARMRKRDPRGDFGRNDRQKQIIGAVVDRITSPNMLLKLDDVAKAVGKNVETNLTVSQGLSLQKAYQNFSSSNIDKLSIQGYDEYMDNVYYFHPDDENLDELKQSLQAHLEHKTDNYQTNNE
nr:LCP family protein [Fredinandcohnia onubensis]